MTAEPQKRPKSLFRKLLKVGLISLLLLLLAVVGGCVYGVWYINSDRVKTFDNIALFGGGSLSVGAISIGDVWSYPEIDLLVCDLHVWEQARTSTDSAFFVVNEGRIRLRADLLNSDTILLRQISYNGGRLHLVKDAQNQDAVERMRNRKSTPKQKPRYTILQTPDLISEVHNVDFRIAAPNQGKDYAGFIKHLDISKLSLGKEKKARIDFDVEMEGLVFKASDGAFVRDTRLQGLLDVEHIGSKMTARIPNLVAGTTAIDFEAELFPGTDNVATLKFDAPSVDMALVRPMLSPGLQAKIQNYDVEGSFPAKVTMHRMSEPGNRPVVEVDLMLRGQRAFIEEYTFEHTYLDGTFYNRLPSQRGQFKPQQRGSTFVIDTVASQGLGFAFETANARVVSPKGEGSILEAKVKAEGPAKALSQLLNSDQYLFTSGTLNVEATVSGPLSETTKMLDQSDATLSFSNPSIRLIDAGVQLPLKHLTIDKKANAAHVELEGVTLSEKHAFHISGDISGLSKIIGGENPEPIRSNVQLESAHLSWADLAAYLGTKSDESETTIERKKKAFDPASLKLVLSSIEASFQPKLEIAVDTLSYQDVLLTKFKTGMNFLSEDTLVLERTTFVLDTAKVGFGGSIYIGEKERTAYQFSMNASHVDVEELLPKINYLNSKLLAELRTLPNDVDIEIEQLGFIHDQDGILPNSSTGFIDLVSNKKKAFRARVDFEPDRPEDPSFNSTKVKLEGNAVLFNDFFDTEEFLFNDGDFEFSMAYAGLVPDLRTLMQNEEMVLDLAGGRVFFKSAALEIPINNLTLDMLRDTAEVRLFLRSEELGQELRIDGVANNLSEVVLGETGKQFSTQASVQSERIVWSDLNALIGTFAGERDTTAELNLRKTTRAIMTKFRPDVQLRIGELQLNNHLSLQAVESGLRLDGQQRLHVDTTGFSYGNGSMKLAGSIDLKNLQLTPFDLFLNTEELNLASLLEGFNHFGVSSLKATKELEGKMSLELNLGGEILGESGKLVPETAKGVMSFRFYDLQVEGLKQIDDVAEKFRMTDRLDNLKFAPLTNVVTLDTNVVNVPLMEIPSSAFRVFLAGDLDIGKGANFWVSVPLANINFPDTLDALQHVGYAQKPLKVHLEFSVPDTNDELKTKFHMSRRKYFKRREMLDEYRASKKSWREERRQRRKERKE